jgi:spermidine/putrescine-binding protein
MRAPRPLISAAATAAALLALLAGCAGTDEAAAEGAATAPSDAPTAKTCFDAFPEAMGTPDLANLTMTPDGWPEPPVEAELCQAFQETDGVSETMGYLSDGASASDVLSAYETALTHLGATRAGDMLTGLADGTTYEVSTPTEDTFVIKFHR